jgi:hypothetical protein
MEAKYCAYAHSARKEGKVTTKKKRERYERNPNLEELAQGMWQAEKIAGREQKALWILKQVKDYYDSKGAVGVIFPKKRKMQEIIAEARKGLDDVPAKRRQKMESMSKPWNLGSLAEYPMPNEALPVVLQCCKEAQLSDSSFTVREAKWCANLSAIINDTRTLVSFTAGYANREIIHEAKTKHSEPFDTSNLDKILTMAPWELATACLTKEIKPIGPSIPKFEIRPEELSFFDAAVPYEPMTVFEPIKTMKIAVDILETQAYDAETSFVLLTPMCSKDIFSMILIPMPEGFSREQFIDMRVSMRKTLSEQQFSHEQMRVYTLWLEYLAAGLHAQTLEERQVRNRIKIVNELRRWIKNHPLAKDSSVLLPFSPEGLFVGASQESQKISAYVLEPLELLEKVGIKSFLEVRRRR